MSKNTNSTSKQKDVFARPTSSSLNRAKVKSEQSPNRLPSLRGPRDLTLGGIKKKTFAPNIPVRKDRNKVEIKEEAKPSLKSSRGKRDRSRDGRPRGRGRGGSFFKTETIQSHGIFEVGPSGESSSRGRESHSTQSESSKQIQRPTIKKERIDLAMEQEESEVAMRKLEEGNTSLIADLQNDENLKPVTLPLFSKPPSLKAAKQENATESSKLCNPSMTSHVFSRQVEGKMIMLQIPDTLPGIPPSEPDSPKIKQEPGTTPKETLKDTQTSRCTLDQLSEGRIGKLQIMKSGRCRLVFGGVYFNLQMGTPSSFAEEFASIRLPPEGSPESSKGHVTILGNIDHKLVCIPDVGSLVKTA